MQSKLVPSYLHVVPKFQVSNQLVRQNVPLWLIDVDLRPDHAYELISVPKAAKYHYGNDEFPEKTNLPQNETVRLNQNVQNLVDGIGASRLRMCVVCLRR
ncbi:hypothetical protein AC579_7173 [Pseudocercospora musae]|uniref:Uncharacterized protein n=1 Tax=Pseudocercospora musae TaxID=113226 RepID=A0A139I891_9PEZI|nr:hypothetical protein AC579_7173 [Pseudocercospora musae]